ncbi:flagellar filament outer layer protein FlaA [Brucepastera parasyntrophica]|uniref:flagellar filament outer layer protein FlaA n=1 Tax=Brucepastera parasyntrophica TaxID=2880008 RepID=UPI00210E4684|nr:flagellar filament outer layer protein FlaA [Brucepastera parasyntrophica]ULQ60130.1 flagellar filament outer layer protein FlaA [Brucepastera parasyntrophica]
MKKGFILVAIAFFLVGAVAVADEAVLIDFALLTADSVNDDDGNATQNGRTVMDYSTVAGDTFTDDQRSLMKTSLAVGNWDVELNSSARNVTSLSVSHVRPAPVSQNAKSFAGQTVMGVRINFPVWNSNANAIIKPPFEIPAYEPMAQTNEDGEVQEPTDEDKATGQTRFEGGYGVVKNVGVIKSIAVNTYGMQFPHGLYVVLHDMNRVEKRYFMGYLKFDGWRELVWQNPAYISDARSREIRLYPVYPNHVPIQTFKSFIVTRDAADEGGDFIGYIKDVKIIYDKAVLDSVRDFADEDIWGIQTKREAERKQLEVSRFGGVQVLRFLEQEKIATETGFTPSEGASANEPEQNAN